MTATASLDAARIEVAPDQVDRMGELLAGPGCAVVRHGVALGALADLRAAIGSQYDALEAAVAAGSIQAASRILPPGMRYQPSAAALGLDGFDGWTAVARALDDGIAAAIRAWFEGSVAVARDATWVRRQYPPAMRTAGQAPHALHQDGAYGFPFPGGAGGGAADLLDMVTAWMPLCRAGVDAPSLEFRLDSPRRLLGLADLARRSAEECGVVPQFEPGDVVLMAGHHVHRTHVSDGMTRARTAIELRFVSDGDGNARLPGPRVALAEVRRR